MPVAIFYYDFPLGSIGIQETDGAISKVFFKSNNAKTRVNSNDAVIAETTLIKQAAAQLKQYFDGKRTTFDLPLLLKGTAFQVSVWKQLQTIPYGQTRTYKELAYMIQNPKACRAVGMANNRNPVSIIVPCHRVIGADGNLTGYASGLDNKRFLLELERKKKSKIEIVAKSP